MKKNLALLCLLFLLSSPASPQAPSTKQTALALTHVTVIDTTGALAQPDVTVVIRGDRIVGMGKSGKVHVPAGSEIVDATGKFLIPGLWDMNVFWYDPTDYLPLLIANGVTGVREMMGYAEHYELRKQIEAGQVLGPRMVVGTRGFDGPMPNEHSGEAGSRIFAANEAEARQAVITAQGYGADFIRLGSSEALPRGAFFALADEAKKRGIPFEGLVPVSVTVQEASNAGMRSIITLPAVLDVEIMAAFSSREADLLKSWQEALAKVLASDQPHAWDTLWEGPGFRGPTQLALETYDQQKAAALFALLRANHTWMCPTLTAERNYAFFEDPSIARNPLFKYMSPAERSWFNEGLSNNRSPEDSAAWKRFYQKYFEIIGAMRRAGVEFLAGTTTEEPTFTVPGFSLHDELALLVQAGFTPIEALQTATRNPGRFLGREHDFGTVAAGRMADLILLEANPLEDISNTRKIAAVVYGGKLFPRASLDAMLAKVQALASRKSIGDVVAETTKEKGVEVAIRQYRELKSTQRDSYDFEDKYGLIDPADRLLRAKKFKEAIQILELNTEMFPRWWWTYNSLGEAYIAVGEKELAIKNYKKSLQLDPANQHAALKLKQLNSQ